MSTQERCKFKVDKLIRDKLPQTMQASGIVVVQRTMDDGEYSMRLKDKLVEEVQEVLEVKDAKEMLEELADVIEVVKALGDTHGISFENILKASCDKKETKGGFGDKIYVERVELGHDHPSLSYYQTRMHKYPRL